MSPAREEPGLTRSRGGSPGTPNKPERGNGGGDGEDDDTLTLPTPTQASHSQSHGHGQDRGSSGGGGGGNNPSSTSSAITSTTSTNIDSLSGPGSGTVITTAGANAPGGSSGGAMESKWMMRLRDLEFKLKAEREGRILDRGEAMKRINASESENAMLRENLERERQRAARR